MKCPISAVLVVLLSTLAGSTAAQVQGTATVAASVTQDLQVTATGETNFGTFANQAHTETIDAAAPTPTQTVAQFTTTATNGTWVIFTCPAAVPLSGPHGSTMSFTPRVKTANYAEGQSASVSVSCTDSFRSDVFPHFSWLGGSLEVLASQEPGDYSGVFTLTATYQ